MNYDDIINLPHPNPRRHPRMSLLERAAQFSPFAALTGFEDVIDDARGEHVSAYSPDTDPLPDDWPTLA